MNSTFNTTNNASNTGPDPWVESGALVYVAMTVAVCAAVIMCCTWFLTSNKTSKHLYAQYCAQNKTYQEVGEEEEEEEEEIELRPNRSPRSPRLSGDSAKRQSPFTLEDSSEGEEGEEVQLDEIEAV